MVTINGEQKDAAGKTVTAVLESMKLDPARTAVMIGGEILPKHEYASARIDGSVI